MVTDLDLLMRKPGHREIKELPPDSAARNGGVRGQVQTQALAWEPRLLMGSVRCRPVHPHAVRLRTARNP